MDCSNRPFWEEFIDLYHQNSCLWDVKSKEYTNKNKRKESYLTLLCKLKETIPGATIETLKKKINNIRTSFRRELKKVLDSKGSGTVYEPTLWYFNSLSFITQSEADRKEKSDDDDADEYMTDVVDSEDVNFLDFQVKEESSVTGPNSPGDVAESSIEAQEDISNCIYAPSSSVVCNTMFSRKRKIMNNKLNSFKQKKLFSFSNSVQKTSEDDELVVTGKKFAFQLKRMDAHQRLIAEKLISDIMFYGGMGKLSEDAVIQLPSRHVQEYCFGNSNNVLS